MNGFSVRGREISWGAAIALALLHFIWLATYQAPAISTPDANSYFAQARWIAQEGTPSFTLASSVQFVAPHWNQDRNGSYTCTQPPGFGLLLALPYSLFGYRAATWVNPLLASLSVLAVFLLCRQWVGSNLALLGATITALNPFLNEHALFGDSHVAVQFFLLAALICLSRWIQGGHIAWGVSAGLLSGAIPALRYPEILYLLPLALFVAVMVFHKQLTWRSMGAFALGAALPLLALMSRNQIAYGGFWRTGYLATGEQDAFSISALIQHAPDYLRLLLFNGAGLMFPLGVAGIVVALRRRETRIYGLLLAGLIAPITLLYMTYYWQIDGQSMRFLIPTFPLYTLASVWLLKRLLRNRSWAVCVSTLVLLATAAWGLPASHMALKHLERDGDLLADITACIEENIPSGSIVIAGLGVQQHLDFVGHWMLADATLVTPSPEGVSLGKGPGPQRFRSHPLHDLPMDERKKAFLDAVLKWAGNRSRVFLLAKPAERQEWEGRLPAGARLLQAATIDLPKASRAPLRVHPAGEGNPSMFPHPAHDKIFDLELDGEPLLLFELCQSSNKRPGY